MRKRILLTLLIAIISIGLFACIDMLPRVDYEAKTSYESELISATEKIENTNVTLVKDNNSSPTTGYANATIVKKQRNDFDYTYTAVTIAEVFNEVDNLAVYVSGEPIINIDKYAISEQYGLAIIVFSTRLNLKAALLTDDNNFNALPILGQTVLTVGTDSNLTYYNVVSEGSVTNTNINNSNYSNHFTHDAARNAGSLGSGVYNLAGYLIGINTYREYEMNDTDSEEFVLSLNYAIDASSVKNLLNGSINYNNHTITNIPNGFETSIDYALSDFETAVTNVLNNSSKGLVEVNGNNNFKSTALVFKKTLNVYRAITINLELESNLKVKINNDVVNVILKKELNDYLSEITFSYSGSLTPINLTNEIPELVHGQTTIVTGVINSYNSKSSNIGELSKVSAPEDEKLFMHSTKTHKHQAGGPIFNLEGNLIGIQIGKVNNITTPNRELAAEGLSFGLKLSEVIKVLNNENIIYVEYESSNDYESKIIELTKNLINTTVTVKTSSGHGSGVIFKKEAIGIGEYRYSVLTNTHVISSRNEKNNLVVNEELSIHFVNDIAPVRVFDYYLHERYDMAIIRFKSGENLDIISSNILKGDEKLNYVKGQIVVAIGTPSLSNRTGYVTVGIINNKLTSYNGQSQLGLTHSAQINSGNSGGPLFNLEGELVALNVAKGVVYPGFDGEEFAEGVGISLNINKIADIYNSVIIPIAYQEMPERTPRIGIVVSPVVSFKEVYPQHADKVAESETGIVIVEVDELFDVYGKVEVYDIIIAVDGNLIHNNEDMVPHLADKEFGHKFTLTILRKGIDEPLNIDVVLS